MKPSAPRQAVILVGGLGTRLGALTKDVPKPLLPVGGRPFISYLLSNLRRHGFDRFLLLAGYRAEIVSAVCGPGSALARDLNADIRVLVEPEPLGTGGALRAAVDELEDTFFLLNGDSFFDINLLAVGVPRKDQLGRLALRRLDDPSRYGVVEVSGDRIVAFHERPPSQGPATVNSGIYHLKREITNAIPRGMCSLERDVFPVLASERRLSAEAFEGFFIDIGIPADFVRANTEIPAAMHRPAVFFDRDGVLNRDHGYTHKIDDLQWMEGAIDAIRWCNDAGYFAFVVTNQSGVARGFYSEGVVLEFHRHMNEELRAAGAHIDDFRYCPHHPEGITETYRTACACRKPGPGMITDLLKRWPIDAARSLVIGDKQSDVDAASAAGLRGVIYRGGSLLELLRASLGLRC